LLIFKEFKVLFYFILFFGLDLQTNEGLDINLNILWTQDQKIMDNE